MSMLQAQCDELRAMAESVGLTVPQAATLMMEAADTILSLRDRAQNLQAENASLRSELDSVGTASYLYGRSDLKAENAKLRELCKDMMAFVEDDDACERCGHDVECVEAADGELVLPYDGQCLMLDLFADRMRELGVEL